MKLALIAVMLISTTAIAQKAQPAKQTPPDKAPAKTFNIGALELGGKVHMLSMLNFIERANDELERAALEKKTFIPKLVVSVDEAPL